jgi:LPXTG-motif cell wall-anchored protein
VLLGEGNIMASTAVGGATVTAALLGSAGTGGAVAFRPTRETAQVLANEMAATGASHTELLVVVGLLVLLAGVLLVGLARRHGFSVNKPRILAPLARGGGGVPTTA